MSLTMKWKALSREEINLKVDHALSKNINYRSDAVMGTPATYLDQKEFYPDASFLETAHFLEL